LLLNLSGSKDQRKLQQITDKGNCNKLPIILFIGNLLEFPLIFTTR
jgi:hypothetical protein